jgi:hypothetical protein
MTALRHGTAPGEIDTTAELAVRAWEARRVRSGCGPGNPPTEIVRVKRQRRAWHKSAVYQLKGVGEGASTVVAKRCLRSTGRVEHEIYDKLLPRFPVPRLPYHGYVEEDDGRFAWLFMGDAGESRPTMADRGVIAEWLARVHAAAADLADEVALPDHGPGHYFSLLNSARAGLVTARAVANSAGHDCDDLEQMAGVLGHVEALWDRVVETCSKWPRTLVHSDFSRKNVRLRRIGKVTEVLVLDWETAGWGPPAADLAGVEWGRSRDRLSDSVSASESETPWYGPVSLDVYAAEIGALWPHLGRADVERLSVVGAVFRIIDATCWATHQVEFGGVDKGMGRLRAYADDLLKAAPALGT